jgi:hypothetical protein
MTEEPDLVDGVRKEPWRLPRLFFILPALLLRRQGDQWVSVHRVILF